MSFIVPNRKRVSREADFHFWFAWKLFTSGFLKHLDKFLEPKFWKYKIGHLSFRIEKRCPGRYTSTFGFPEKYLLPGFWTTSTRSWSRNFGKLKFIIYHSQSKEDVSGGRLPLLFWLKSLYFGELLGFSRSSRSSWTRKFGKIKFVIYHFQLKEDVWGGRLALLVCRKAFTVAMGTSFIVPKSGFCLISMYRNFPTLGALQCLYI